MVGGVCVGCMWMYICCCACACDLLALGALSRSLIPLELPLLCISLAEIDVLTLMGLRVVQASARGYCGQAVQPGSAGTRTSPRFSQQSPSSKEQPGAATRSPDAVSGPE